MAIHGERPCGYGVGVEATMDRLLAGLPELALPLFVAQQGGKLVTRARRLGRMLSVSVWNRAYAVNAAG